MSTNFYLNAIDYLVIVLSLAIPTAIGIYFRVMGSRQGSKMEYLLAGRDMWLVPVMISIVVTMTSAVSMIGTPSEVYKYGTLYIIFYLFLPFGMVLASTVLIPVYFECGVFTIYEFLEMRYGKLTRYIVSALFIVHMVMYMSSVLFAPVLALSAVTDLSLEASILVFGAICSIYCAVGGLKAVLWTDVFQSILMLSCIIAIYSAGIIDSGGIANVYNRAKEGGRLIMFDTDLDVTKRYTVWNCIARGVLYGVGAYGANQTEVQRLLSMRNLKRAKSTLLFSIVPVVLLYSMCSLMGIILFSVFYNCDPILDQEHTGLHKYDQLIPYYIVRRFSEYPGLTGLCIAGIFSGSLSTVSSALNSLATVTVVDFVQPFKPGLSDTTTVIIAKGLSLFYGAICIMFSFALSNTDSIKKATGILYAVLQSPLAAVFLIGVLTRTVSHKSILFGLFCSIIITGSIGFNSLFYGYSEPTLPLTTSACASQRNDTLEPLSECRTFSNCTATSSVNDGKSSSFAMGKISYMWTDLIGFTLSIIFTFSAHLVLGSKGGIRPDPKCQSPVTKLWKKKKATSDESQQNGTNDTELKSLKQSDVS